MLYRQRHLVLWALLGWSAHAWAQAPETDRNLAQSLFEQARQLMGAGRFEEACPKLEESQRLDPGGGTQLNLGLCHEKQGKIATAWTDFKGALSLARRDGRQERAAAAEERIAALEPRLPWLTLAVAGAAEGEQVTLDGAAVGKAAWGSPIAIDPGTHVLSASAFGRKPWSGTVSVVVGEKLRVSIPELETTTTAPSLVPTVVPSPNSTPELARTAVPPPNSAPELARSARPSGRNTAAWIIGGTGVVALGIGTIFGVRTLAKKKDSDAQCPTDASCSREGVTLNDEAHTSAWISDIGFGLGIVGVGVGTYLLLTGGPAEQGQKASARGRSALSFDVRASSQGARAVLGGSW